MFQQVRPHQLSQYFMRPTNSAQHQRLQNFQSHQQPTSLGAERMQAVPPTSYTYAAPTHQSQMGNSNCLIMNFIYALFILFYTCRRGV